MDKNGSSSKRQREKKEIGADCHSPNDNHKTVSYFFDRFAAYVTRWAGSSIAFGLAVMIVLVWAVCGPAYDYSATWQLIINTGTTIITFLMVFLIQQSQNKDSRALHLKLNELLIALQGANEGLVDSENLDEDQLHTLAAACKAKAKSLASSTT